MEDVIICGTTQKAQPITIVENPFWLIFHALFYSNIDISISTTLTLSMWGVNFYNGLSQLPFNHTTLSFGTLPENFRRFQANFCNHQTLNIIWQMGCSDYVILKSGPILITSDFDIKEQNIVRSHRSILAQSVPAVLNRVKIQKNLTYKKPLL